MGIDLVTESHYSSLGLAAHYDLLQLARQCGWVSTGTADINEYQWDAEQRRIGFVAACEKYLAEDPAREDYYGGDYWCIISAADSRNLANALRKIVASEMAVAAGYGFRLETLQKLIELYDDGPVVVS